MKLTEFKQNILGLNICLCYLWLSHDLETFEKNKKLCLSSVSTLKKQFPEKATEHRNSFSEMSYELVFGHLVSLTQSLYFFPSVDSLNIIELELENLSWQAEV